MHLYPTDGFADGKGCPGIPIQLTTGNHMNILTTGSEIEGQVAQELACRRMIRIEVTVDEYCLGHDAETACDAPRVLLCWEPSLLSFKFAHLQHNQVFVERLQDTIGKPGTAIEAASLPDIQIEKFDQRSPWQSKR